MDVDARLDWIEKAALENLRGHVQTAETLAKEAGATLTVLLAALAGAFSYAIKAEEFQAGAVALTVYLFLLCGVLVKRAMMIVEFPAITNEPRNLNQGGVALELLRRAELINIQSRIDQGAERNATTAQWLNRVRLAAIASPVAFLVAILASELVRRVG